MKSAKRFARIASAALLLLSGCIAGPRIPPHRGLDALWRKYQELPMERAMAIAGNPNRLWVGAIAGGAESQAEADERALAGCRLRRQKRRMQPPCLLYASGDEIVWRD